MAYHPMDIKARVRKRDKNKCQCCGRNDYGKSGQVHDVHRIVPGEPYQEAFCVTLCRACHMYMPKKVEDILYPHYKGIFGIIVSRTGGKSESLIAKIRKVIADHEESDKEVGVMYFGIGAKETKTGKPPKKLFVREHRVD